MGSEDCLTINVWTPSTAPSTRRSVLVFIHGGFFTWGASSTRFEGVDSYDGRFLAAHIPAVVVTFNYRLGPLGFTSHPALAAESPDGSSGNYGLRDQIAALAWVQRNIAAFGGDPAQVTLMGQSAGAVSTAALLASPLAAGLFSRVIMHSGYAEAASRNRAEAQGKALATRLGCAAVHDVAACLRAASAAAVIAALPEDPAPKSGFDPSIDGYVLKEDPLAAAAAGRDEHVPVLLGTTTNELSTWPLSFAPQLVTGDTTYVSVIAAAFGVDDARRIAARYPLDRYPSAYQALVALWGDALFVCPANRLARALALSTHVYRFVYAHVFEHSLLATLGAAHGFDLGLVFRNLPPGLRLEPSEQALADDMLHAWSRFAATGDPNGGATIWPSYDPTSEPYLEFDTTPVPRSGVRKEECALWDAIGNVRDRR
jgi:para-nitrobenzyl esterase